MALCCAAQGEDDEALLREEPAVAFSGEEGLGRYLDLHDHFHAYVNSRFGRQVDYYTYVSSCLQDLASVPRAQRLARPYRDYLAALVAYLESFYARTQPLAQLDKQYAKVRACWGGVGWGGATGAGQCCVCTLL